MHTSRVCTYGSLHNINVFRWNGVLPSKCTFIVQKHALPSDQISQARSYPCRFNTWGATKLTEAGTVSSASTSWQLSALSCLVANEQFSGAGVWCTNVFRKFNCFKSQWTLVGGCAIQPRPIQRCTIPHLLIELNSLPNNNKYVNGTHINTDDILGAIIILMLTEHSNWLNNLGLRE